VVGDLIAKLNIPLNVAERYDIADLYFILEITDIPRLTRHQFRISGLQISEAGARSHFTVPSVLLAWLRYSWGPKNNSPA
jgi:hypothetical protein